MLNKFLILVILIFFVSFDVAAQTSNTGEINSTHAAVLQKWLVTKPALRLARDKDYAKNSLDFVRQSEGIGFVPYYLAKDFNGDRKEDFAVILTSKKGKRAFAVAVFNAPIGKQKMRQPAFFTTAVEADDVLYFNQSTKRLLVGPYGSDAGFALKPSGKTYKVETFGD